MSRKHLLTLGSILIILSMVLSACAQATPAPTQAPAEPMATEAPAEPVATEAPAEPVATEAPADRRLKHPPNPWKNLSSSSGAAVIPYPWTQPSSPMVKASE